MSLGKKYPVFIGSCCLHLQGQTVFLQCLTLMMKALLHITTCYYLWRECWVCLRLSWGSWHLLTQSPFCFSLSRQCANLAVIWIVIKNTLMWSKWNSEHISNCMGNDFYVFGARSLDSPQIQLFCYQWIFWAFPIFSTTFKLWKPLRHLCSLLCLLSKS